MIRPPLSIVLFAASSLAQAQVTFGVLAGPTYSTAKFTDGLELNTAWKWGMSAGCQLGVPLVPHLALQPELVYRQKGFDEVSPENAFQDYRFRWTYDHLDFALLFRGYLNKAHRGAYLAVGPSVGWFMGGRVRDMDPEPYAANVPQQYQDSPLTAIDPGWYGLNRIDVALCAGLGLSLPVGTTALGLELRYQHGFSNVHKGLVLLDVNGQMIAQLNSTNRGIMFNLSWMLPVGSAEPKEGAAP